MNDRFEQLIRDPTILAWIHKPQHMNNYDTTCFACGAVNKCTLKSCGKNMLSYSWSHQIYHMRFTREDDDAWIPVTHLAKTLIRVCEKCVKHYDLLCFDGSNRIKIQQNRPKFAAAISAAERFTYNLCYNHHNKRPKVKSAASYR